MIQITADTRRAVVTNKELLTTGSAGIQVQFTLSEDWAALAKVAVFRQGDEGEKVDCVLDSDLTCVVPAEILTTDDEVVFCGIYGSNGQGTIIIPTIWASLGVVRPGTLPGTPAEAQPTPSVWAQILSVAQDAEETADAAMSYVGAGLQDLTTLESSVEAAESNRVTAEQARATSEQQRVGSENSRQIAENARITAESARSTAESTREWERNNFLRDGVNATTLAPGSPATVTRTLIGSSDQTATTTGSITFGIPQGKKGDPGAPGVDGDPGADGYSPTVTVATITGGHRVTITDKTHPTGQSFDVMDGSNDAGSVTYDETATYQAGSVGAELSNQSRHLSDLEDSISDAYDPTASYAVGDFCINENTLYRCNTAIPTGGEVWTPAHWDAVQITDFLGSGSGGAVSDVQINGTSILSEGVANIPVSKANTLGVVKINYVKGITANSSGELEINAADENTIKNGTYNYYPIMPKRQHESAFYGLAKAAGDATQSASANAVGAYTEDAKSAIHEMLNGSVAVSGTTPTIVAKSGITYVCGEVATLDITPPASGIFEVQFVSGSTPTVLTATGVTWANGFDPTALEANKTYDISISNGIGVAVWI